MSKMKYSGLEWIGNIPEEWEISTMKYDCKKITDFTASGSFADLAENVEYLDNPDYAMLVRIADLSNKRDVNHIYINQKAYRYLKNSNLYGGELILSNIGSVGEVFYYTPIYENSSLAPNSIMAISKYSTKYLYYYFMSPTISAELKMIGGNAVQNKFNKTQLRQFKTLLPKLNEQKIIVNFLDEKVGNLDKILSDLNKQVELLNDYKRELITEKVTENNKYTIQVQNGKICLNFENKSKIVRIKNVLNGVTDGTHGTFDRVYEGEYLLSAKNVFENGLHIGDSESMISYKDYREIIKCGYPKKNDLLMCCVGTIGRTMIYKENKPIAFQRSILFMRVDNSKILPEFLNYSMNSNYMLEQEKILVNKSAQDGIYQGTVKNMYLYLPSLNKQKEIVDYLDKKCEQIDKIIEEKQKQIEKIEEYKKFVIYEYVTGKKRVEGAEELYG